MVQSVWKQHCGPENRGTVVRLRQDTKIFDPSPKLLDRLLCPPSLLFGVYGGWVKQDGA